jgi:hypothetical protein
MMRARVATEGTVLLASISTLPATARSRQSDVPPMASAASTNSAKPAPTRRGMVQTVMGFHCGRPQPPPPGR